VIRDATGFDREKLKDDAVAAFVINDDVRRRYLQLAGDVDRLFKSLLPDIAANEFSAVCKVFSVIAAKIRIDIPAADISDVMDDVASLLDYSIATQGYVIKASETTNYIDLSQIDFDALRAKFDKGRRATEAQKLRSQIAQKLTRMIRLNRTRIDFLQEFQKMIDDYNSGASNIETWFAKLTAFAQKLSDEEKRGISEQLSEEELVVFDLLTKPEIKMTKAEEQQVKKVAKDLLETRGEKDWCWTGRSGKRLGRRSACLRRMLTIAKRTRKIHDIPFIEFLKEPPARKGFLTVEKFEELIALLPTHLRPLVTLLYYCGTRIGEALQIEWSQVNLDERTIRLEEEQTKTGEARVLPLPPSLVMMLAEVEPKSGRVFDGTNLRKEWTKACAAASLGTLTEVEGRPYDPIYSGLTLHDLRRSAVRNLVNAGVPERVAMSISRHKTRSVFDRYHIVSTEDVTNAMQKVVTASLGNGTTKSLSDGSRK